MNKGKILNHRTSPGMVFLLCKADHSPQEFEMAITPEELSAMAIEAMTENNSEPSYVEMPDGTIEPITLPE